MISRRPVLMAIGGVLLFLAVGVAWWLLSPLFISKTVRESFPMTEGALLPPGMDRAEAEGVMAGLAKMKLEMREQAPPGVGRPQRFKVGAFRDGDALHKGSGKAIIYRLPDGSRLLRLENLEVTNGPALHVLLARHPDPQRRADVKEGGFADLGRLKGNIGDQNYPIPPGVDLAAHRSVVIFCVPFQVVFSVASLIEVP